LLLDEPTAHLDQDYSARLQNVLRKVMQQTTQLVVVVSHDWQWLEQLCDRVLQLQDGRLVRDELAPNIAWQALATAVTVEAQAIEDEWN
jgi:ABC-type sulfate/molybdate transport systems ATPase subunit